MFQFSGGQSDSPIRGFLETSDIDPGGHIAARYYSAAAERQLNLQANTVARQKRNISSRLVYRAGNARVTSATRARSS